ncbi:hypothetical protein Tco_0773164 [Tanacetum coccineum]|uniref:Synaptobrevin, longin-like domain protein n=1 Tax=Tanacetum coccineum TaxID=301880 RepID=A0ABQ4ZNT1_9ASTR
MAALVSCPKHNMVACLEKTERNAQFHEIVDFLTRSLIYYSLTVSPTVSTSLIEQFWNTATSKIVNNVSYIKAKVAGKTISISEASIRRDLLFNDVDGIDCLTNQDIYENLQLMGYEGDLTILTFLKALFSPQWKYLIHTLIYCLSSKSTSWDQFPTNIASALICLATYRNFNFSKIIFKGMIRNLDAKKQFLMYPRFVQVFLNNQLSNLPAPLDNLPIPILTKKVFTNMAKQGLHFSGHVTPLFPKMLAQAVVDTGEGSEQPTEPQPTPSPTQPCTGDQPPMTESSYSPDTTQDPRAAEILKLKTRIQKLEKKCKPSISHHRAWLKCEQRLSMKKMLGKKESVSKQGRKNAKSKPTLDAFDDLDANLAHGMDYMETEEAVNEGRQSNETKELNLDVDTKVIAKDKDSGKKGGSTVSTVRPDVDTARPDVDTARPDIGTARPEVHTANAPVSTAGVTISTADPEMKEEKAKEKGVAFKDVEDSSRPVRSITTLKPLPSIDPKDKGKELAHKLHEEELAEIARIQEEKAAQEEASRVTIMEMFDEVQAAAQRKFRAAQRAAEIRIRPPTKSQLRNLMMTYLKNIDDVVKDSKKAAGEDTLKKKEVLKEPDKSDLEEEEGLKTFLKIVPDIKGIIDYEVLEKIFLIINWESKFYHYDIHGAEGIYYRIFRSDGSSGWIKTFFEMVTRFDRLDLVELYNLVMQKFKTITPEGVDLVFWGDLRTMFDKNAKDELWQNQERWNIKSWNFYKNCGVHSLTLEDLIAESASDSAYDLLRFIQKQIDEAGSHDGGEKDL